MGEKCSSGSAAPSGIEYEPKTRGPQNFLIDYFAFLRDSNCVGVNISYIWQQLT